MRETLIQILDLAPAEGAGSVSDDQIVAAVKAIKSRDDEAAAATRRERAITDLVNQSGDALSREAAKEVLAARSAAAGK